MNNKANAQALLEAAKKSFVGKDFVGAERSCRSIIGIAPELAGPWIILADIELRRRRPEAALAWADKAIALEPRSPFAHLVRCRCLVADTRLKDAFESTSNAVATLKCPPAVLDEFGMVFTQLGRHAESLDCFRRAAAGDPNNAKFIFNLAVAERTLGQLEAAERHCENAILCDPHLYNAYFIRADLRKQTPHRNHVAELEKLLARTETPSGEILVRFALGKECEDIGDYGRAFQHIRAGADMKRKRLRLDVRGNVAVVNRVIRNQTREALDSAAARAASASPSHDDPIFIVGLPRSGTTLVERIVASHSRIAAGGELSALPNELTRAALSAGIKKAGEWAERLDTIDASAIGNAYSRVARELRIPNGMRFTDKYPPNFLYCGVVRVALPSARIVALRRRAMDSCYAMYKQLFEADAFPYSYDFEDLAQYYAATRRLMAHWRTALPERQFLELSYEEIVGDPEGQSRLIIEFLGLDWEEGVLNFHEQDAPVATASAVQVRRPIYASSIGKWRNYSAELEPLRARLAELMPGEDLG